MAERKIYTVDEWEALTPEQQKRVRDELPELTLDDLSPEFRERVLAMVRRVAADHGMEPDSGG